jgi:hypothetical protein
MERTVEIPPFLATEEKAKNWMSLPVDRAAHVVVLSWFTKTMNFKQGLVFGFVTGFFESLAVPLVYKLTKKFPLLGSAIYWSTYLGPWAISAGLMKFAHHYILTRYCKDISILNINTETAIWMPIMSFVVNSFFEGLAEVTKKKKVPPPVSDISS